MRLPLILSFCLASCFGQTATLTQYLNLSTAQKTAITKLTSDYAIYLRGQESQRNTLNQQLAQFYAAGSPDPVQIGTLYVQIEMINRDEAAHQSTLAAQIAAQLTSAQAALIPPLSQSITLTPLFQDASCGFLMSYTSPVGFGVGILGVPTYAQRSGDFSFISNLPYIPPAPSATFCGSQVFPISIREYLSLTDAQISALANASAGYNSYYAKMQDQTNDLSINIRDETAKPSPDPAALGFFYASLASIGQNIQNQGIALRQQALTLLSDPQKATLKSLQDSAALQPLAYQALVCGLLSQPPGSGTIYAAAGCQL